MKFFKRRSITTVRECKRKMWSAIWVLVIHIACFVVGVIIQDNTTPGRSLDGLAGVLLFPTFIAAIPLFFVLYNVCKSPASITYEDLMFWGFVYYTVSPSERRVMENATVTYIIASFILKLLLFLVVTLCVCIPWMLIRIVYAIYSLIRCCIFLKNNSNSASA